MNKKICSTTKLSENGKAIVFCFDSGKTFMIPVSRLKDITEDTKLEMDMIESRRKMRSKEIEQRGFRDLERKRPFFKNSQKNEGRSQKAC